MILLGISLSCSLAIALYLLATKHRKKGFFQVIIIFQIVNIGYMSYRMALYNSNEDTLSLNAIPLTLVSNIILYGIDLINLQTLNLFSVLDSRITRLKILVITSTFTILFIWSEVIYIVNWAVYNGENVASVLYLVISS